MRSPLLIVCGAVFLIPGCSALHWGGEAAGRSPGLRIDMPGAFGGGGVSATADTTASAGRIAYIDEKGGRRLEAENIAFGQSAASVVREEPAKLDAIARVQQSQVEYAAVAFPTVRGIVQDLVPILNLLAAAPFIQTEQGWNIALPNGFEIGTHKVTTPGELQELLRAVAERLRGLPPPPPEVPAEEPGEALRQEPTEVTPEVPQ